MNTDNTPDKKGLLAGLGRHGEHPYGDLGQIIILIGFLAIWILDSYAPIYIRLVVASLFLVFAIYLVRSGHRAISEDVLSSPRLLTDGAFSRVRHPIYLAALLFYIMLIVLTLSMISMLVFAGIFLFCNYIAAYEEKVLEQKYGQDYRDYKKSVPKWIPRLKL